MNRKSFLKKVASILGLLGIGLSLKTASSKSNGYHITIKPWKQKYILTATRGDERLIRVTPDIEGAIREFEGKYGKVDTITYKSERYPSQKVRDTELKYKNIV